MGWDPMGDFQDFVRTTQNNFNTRGENFGANLLSLTPVGALANSGILGNDVRNAYRTGANNIVGEVDGSNKQRQQDWQNQVASDAETARLKQISDRNTAAQNQDTAASNAAASAQKQGWINKGTSGFNLNWMNPSGKDTTDFLGL